MIFVCKLLNLYNFIFMKIGNINEYIFRMFQKCSSERSHFVPWM